MKLLDILKRDLKTWPEGAVVAVQDSEGGTTVKFAGRGHSRLELGLLGYAGVWQCKKWGFSYGSDFITELADDWVIARVTEDMWKSETALSSVQGERTRQAIIDLAARQCGLSGDAIRLLATVLTAEGFRKFEIVEEDV